MEPMQLIESISCYKIKCDVPYNIIYIDFNDSAYDKQLFEEKRTPEVYGIFLN